MVSKTKGRSSQGYPQEIQQSIDAVRSFISKRTATKCHFCQSNLAGDFSAREWSKRWAHAQRSNSPYKGLYICSATCPNCGRLTCLGCGKKPKHLAKPRKVRNYAVDWCCRDGRMLALYIFLWRLDYTELHNRMVADKKRKVAASHRQSMSPYAGDTLDSRGIGYANYPGRGENLHEIGFDGGELSQPINFEVVDDKTDSSRTAIFELIQCIIPAASNKDLPREVYGMLQLSAILDKAAEYLRNDSLDDVTKREDLYRAVIKFVEKLAAHPELASLVKKPRYYKKDSCGLEAISRCPASYLGKDSSKILIIGEKIPSVGEQLQPLAKQSDIVIAAPESQGAATMNLFKDITALYNKIAPKKSKAPASTSSPEKLWEAFHKENCMIRDDRVKEYYKYIHEANAMTQSPPGHMKRLVNELASMSTSLPLGVFVRASEDRPDIMKCLIMGPPDSPYGYGLFIFHIFCNAQYSNVPPLVFCPSALGVQDMSPNLHPDVCLSLLGTWREGDAAAQWQPGKSTIMQVLTSIQAMVLAEDPWHNEPMNDGLKNVEMEAKRYKHNVQLMVIQEAMLDIIKVPETRNSLWRDIINTHFKLNREKILENVSKWAKENPSIERCRTLSGTTRNMLRELRDALEEFR